MLWEQDSYGILLARKGILISCEKTYITCRIDSNTIIFASIDTL